MNSHESISINSILIPANELLHENKCVSSSTGNIVSLPTNAYINGLMSSNSSVFSSSSDKQETPHSSMPRISEKITEASVQTTVDGTSSQDQQNLLPLVNQEQSFLRNVEVQNDDEKLQRLLTAFKKTNQEYLKACEVVDEKFSLYHQLDEQILEVSSVSETTGFVKDLLQFSKLTMQQEDLLVELTEAQDTRDEILENKENHEYLIRSEYYSLISKKTEQLGAALIQQAIVLSSQASQDVLCLYPTEMEYLDFYLENITDSAQGLKSLLEPILESASSSLHLSTDYFTNEQRQNQVTKLIQDIEGRSGLEIKFFEKEQDIDIKMLLSY